MKIYADSELWQVITDPRKIAGMESLLFAELKCAVITRNKSGETQVDLFTEVPQELKGMLGGK